MTIPLKDFLTSINTQKNDLCAMHGREQVRSDYPAYIVNKALSFHMDAILPANAMNNIGQNAPGDIQYEFLREFLGSRSRFAKFARQKTDDLLVDGVMQIWDCSKAKAEEIIDLLPAQIKTRIVEDVEDVRRSDRRAETCQS